MKVDVFERYRSQYRYPMSEDDDPVMAKRYQRLNALAQKRDQQNMIIDRVPVSDGYVIVENNLATISSEVVDLDSLGTAIYLFNGGNVSLAKNAIDEKLTQSGTLNFTSLSGDNGAVQTSWKDQNKPYRGYLLGAAITGSNFTTRGPNKVEYVLRDPGGSNSFAQLDKAVYIGTETTYEVKAGFDFETSAEAVVGAKLTAGTGVGFMVLTDALDVENSIGGTTSTKYRHTDGNTQQSVTTIGRGIATSADEDFVGAQSDIFIGNANNLVFSEATTVRLYSEKEQIPNGLLPGTEVDLGNGYYLAQRSSFDVSPEFETNVVYT